MTNTPVKKLTQERLKELFIYSKKTGNFYHFNVGGRKAGYKNRRGYIKILVDNKWYKAHRLAVLYVTGEFPKLDVDHVDGIKDNNKWDNIRCATRSQNMRNIGIRSNNKSGVTGVFNYKKYGHWRACISYKGERVYLGSFSDKISAVKARYRAEVKYNFYKYNKKSPAYLYLKYYK